jgi:uncharacterized protein YqfA (UPF0365 family)
MSQPNPDAQQAAQQQQQAQMAMVEAQLQEMQAKAQREQAEAAKAMAEAQATPQLTQAKLISALTNNLNEDNESADFERRVKLAELALKQEDIQSNERIAALQTMSKQAKMT